MRYTAGRRITVQHNFLSDDEETPMTVTETTARLLTFDGTLVTEVAGVGAADEWFAVFQPQPIGSYKVEWVSPNVTDWDALEVVANPLFTVKAARGSDEFLADSTEIPSLEIIQYRGVVEQEFEQITGRSFTTRARDVLFTSDGSGEHVGLLPDSQGIESVYVDGVALDDISDWTVSRLGKITYPTIDEGLVVRVRVRYGFTVPPLDVQRVGMIRLRHLIASESSGIPDRATTWQPEEGGTFRLATAGAGKWKTGIPEVDSTLANYTLDTVLSVFASG